MQTLHLGQSAHAHLRHPALLLVEDNPAHAEIILRCFEDIALPHPLLLHHARNGEEALAHLHPAAQPGAPPPILPDCILLDIKLPRMNGFHILETIRQHPATRHLPVIILSSSKADHDIARAYLARTTAFVVKPDDYPGYLQLITSIALFWLRFNQLPPATI